MGLQNSGDDIDIEAELLIELQELDRNYDPNSLSPTSSSDTLAYDFSDEALLNIATSSEDHCDDVNNCVSDDILDNSCSDKSHLNLLGSIPGYESFKESSALKTASCVATSKTIDSIKHIVGEDIYVNKINKQLNIANCTNYNLPTELEKLPKRCKMKDGEHKFVSNGMNEESITCKKSRNIFCPTTIRTREATSSTSSTKSMANTVQSTKNDSHNLRLLAILEDEVRPLVAEKLQEEIENEARQEQMHQERKRNKIIRQRAMDASKEKQTYAIQSKSARTVQIAFREYQRKKRAYEMQRINKGLEQICIWWECLTLKYSLRAWIQFVVSRRAAMLIQFQLLTFLNRKRKRRRMLSETLSHLVNTMTMRKFFLFWTIYLSTMKLQERLMYQLKNSATIIQSAFRKYQAKCLFQRYKEKNGAMTIQRYLRGYWTRHKVYLMKEYEHKKRMSQAAIIIQRYYRGYYIRIRLDKAIMKNYSYVDTEVDKILSEEAIDILGEIFGTMDMETSSSQWKPSKPKTKKVNNISISTDGNSSNQADENTDRCDDYLDNLKRKESPPDHTNDNTNTPKKYPILQLSKNVTNECQVDEPTSTNEFEVDKNEVNSNSFKINENKEEDDLMKEWKLSDERVIKSMMRRKAKMTKNKKRGELNKRLSNPVNRFKRLMKNVCKRDSKNRILP